MKICRKTGRSRICRLTRKLPFYCERGRRKKNSRASERASRLRESHELALSLPLSLFSFLRSFRSRILPPSRYLLQISSKIASGSTRFELDAGDGCRGRARARRSMLRRSCLSPLSFPSLLAPPSSFEHTPNRDREETEIHKTYALKGRKR